MKLYEIPQGSKIKADMYRYTEGGRKKKIGDMVTFHHIDGMYSFCTVDNKELDVVHFPANQELKKVGDYYETV